MNELYNEPDLVNENDDDQTLFFNHVVKEDDTLVAIDNMLKESFKTL